MCRKETKHEANKTSPRLIRKSESAALTEVTPLYYLFQPTNKTEADGGGGGGRDRRVDRGGGGPN